MAIVIHTTRQTPGYLGHVEYALLQFDATERDNRRLHYDKHGNLVFRHNSEAIYISVPPQDGEDIVTDTADEKDIAQWVRKCLELQNLYGRGQRKRAAYTHTFTISWHPLDNLTPEQAMSTARRFVETYLEGFGVLCIRHFDRANKHVHLVVCAWRERDLDEDRPWMRRGKDGNVLPSEKEAGRKLHCNRDMILQMNDHLYQESMNNGWVAVDVNAIIRQKKGVRYDEFTLKIRETLCYLAEVSKSQRDFYTLMEFYKMEIVKKKGENEKDTYEVRNSTGRWVRSFEELDLSQEQQEGIIYYINNENSDVLLSAEAQAFRAGCIASVPQARTWRELCEVLSEQYLMQLQYTNKNVYISVAGQEQKVSLQDLRLPLQDMRRIEELAKEDEERARRKASFLDRMPKQEQLKLVAMLGSEIVEADEICQELYNRYGSIVDDQEMLEQYWRAYYSAVDLFWSAYKATGREERTRYKEEMDWVYEQVREVRKQGYKMLESFSEGVTGLILSSVFLGPIMLLLAAVYFALIIQCQIRMERQIQDLLLIKEDLKKSHYARLARHRALAQKAMGKELSLVERCALLRQLETDCWPYLTEQLLEDMEVYTRTPAKGRGARYEYER